MPLLPELTVSIVSHRQNALVNGLLADLGRLAAARVKVIVTENVPDEVALDIPGGLRCEVVVNSARKGFGANHNAAFRKCDTPFFCISNPDVRLKEDPFPALLEAASRPRTGVVGPLVRTPRGEVEDSARRFPSVARLVSKLLRNPRGPDYPVDRGTLDVEWIGGMFMLCRSEAFARVGGFDESYFLYYEDVDLCLRLGRAGLRVAYVPSVEIVHDARRGSRRDLTLAAHHSASLMRFLWRRATGA